MSGHTEERRVFTEFLKKKGLKTTRERTALFDEIFSAHRHFDAEDLVIRMRERGTKISRATIYRTLEILHECGLVGRVRLNEEKYRYERLKRGEHHDHLVCTSCGKVIEFNDARDREAAGRGLPRPRLPRDRALAPDLGPLRKLPGARGQGRESEERRHLVEGRDRRLDGDQGTGAPFGVNVGGTVSGRP